MNQAHVVLITLPFQRTPYGAGQPWHQLVGALGSRYKVVVAKDVRFPDITTEISADIVVLRSGEIRACDSTQRWDQGLLYILDCLPEVQKVAHIAGDLDPEVDSASLVNALLSEDAAMVLGDYEVPLTPPNAKRMLGDYAKEVFATLFGDLISEYERGQSPCVSKIRQVRSEYFAYTRDWLEARRAQWQLRWLPWAATMQNLVWSMATFSKIKIVDLGSVSDTLAKEAPQRAARLEGTFQMDRVAFVAMHTFSWVHEKDDDFWSAWQGANSRLLDTKKQAVNALGQLCW